MTVTKDMPQIPKDELGGRILKPARMELKAGDKLTFTITGAHSTREFENRLIYSLPVKGADGVEAIFPLNKTNLAVLVKHLGDNSDTWPGATFDALVVPSRNPRTGESTLSWSVTSVQRQTKLKK